MKYLIALMVGIAAGLAIATKSNPLEDVLDKVEGAPEKKDDEVKELIKELDKEE